uniref:Uncharacterized protein n=1 Tax=Rhizophora mucronata TaxID=61149 RepID=A0A2P2PIU9_RHIMU
MNFTESLSLDGIPTDTIFYKIFGKAIELSYRKLNSNQVYGS